MHVRALSYPHRRIKEKTNKLWKWLIEMPIYFISEIICIDKMIGNFSSKKESRNRSEKPIKWNQRLISCKIWKMMSEAKFEFSKFYFFIFRCLSSFFFFLCSFCLRFSSSRNYVKTDLCVAVSHLSVTIFANCVKSHKTAMNWWIIANKSMCMLECDGFQCNYL